MEEKELNLPRRRVPSDLCGCSTPPGGASPFPVLRGDWAGDFLLGSTSWKWKRRVISRDKAWQARPGLGDRGRLQQWQVMSTSGSLARTDWNGHSTSVAFLPQTHEPSITMRKTSDKPKLRMYMGGEGWQRWRDQLRLVVRKGFLETVTLA